MGRWMMLAAVVAASCGLGGAGAARAAQPEGVVLRPRFEQGRTERYEIAASLGSETVMEGREPERESVEQKVTVRAEVQSVDRLGVARVTLRLERAEVTYSAPGEAAERFVWQEGQEGPERVLPLEVMYLELAEEGLELQVGPDGTVRSVAGLEEVVAAGEGMKERSRARALGVFAPGSAEENLSVLWRLDPGETPVRRSPGDTWRVERVVPLGPAGSAAAVTTYTLAGVEEGVATVEGTTSVSIRPRRGEADPALPALSVESGENGTMRAAWDVSEGALRAREQAGTLAWTARLATSEPMAATTTMRERVTVRRVAPDQEPEPERP